MIADEKHLVDRIAKEYGGRKLMRLPRFVEEFGLEDENVRRLHYRLHGFVRFDGSRCHPVEVGLHTAMPGEHLVEHRRVFWLVLHNDPLSKLVTVAEVRMPQNYEP